MILCNALETFWLYAVTSIFLHTVTFSVTFDNQSTAV